MKAWQKSHSLIYARIPKDEVRAVSQQSHARRRYEERFKKELTYEEYEDVLAQIRDPKRGWHLETQSTRVSVWCVTIYGEDVVVMYDKKTRQVRTFYTPEMWEENIEARRGEEEV